MGWLYLRKTFRFGPLRFTLSRHGLSTSVGVKGLRFSVGPRGPHVRVSRRGLNYYKRIGGHGWRS